MTQRRCLRLLLWLLIAHELVVVVIQVNPVRIASEWIVEHELRQECEHDPVVRFIRQNEHRLKPPSSQPNE